MFPFPYLRQSVPDALRPDNATRLVNRSRPRNAGYVLGGIDLNPSVFWLAVLTILVAITGCDQYRDPPPPTTPGQPRITSEYPQYGGDGGRHYVDAHQITTANVQTLRPLWSYHTGELSEGAQGQRATAAAEATPILAEGRLYYCSPFNRVIALDPASGAELWSHDPKINRSGRYPNQMVCRGVSFWRDSKRSGDGNCASRIFTATNDARLIALDAVTGVPCADFGERGEVSTSRGVGKLPYPDSYQHTSPPTIIGDVVVVGSSIADSEGPDGASGVVRGFDARSGALRWSQDLVPPGFVRDPSKASTEGYALASPNVWAPMIADAALGLVYAPTGNPLPDYFRARDVQLAYYGSSLVALAADTGQIVWHYQFVHRDYWDYDTPAQPTLFMLRRDGRDIPAVAQVTKTGFVFVLDRRTGESLFPVEERPAPQNSAFPDLLTSPTQPVPLLPRPISDQVIGPDDAFGLSPIDRYMCRRDFAKMRYAGPFTPVSPEWTLVYPGNAGGSNWGGLAIDERQQTLVVNATNLAFQVRLVPRQEYAAARETHSVNDMMEQAGTPWAVQRRPWLSPFGIPCTPPPWGQLTAIDLATGEQRWQATLGTTRDMSPIPIGLDTGTPNLGGPLLTGGGLTFIGAAADNYLRAFDNRSGAELWRARLPAPAMATPMSYTVKDDRGRERQLVVVAAGGNGRFPGDKSDALIAFALPQDDN
jgi:quinoprotein glucose dehydrogenase